PRLRQAAAQDSQIRLVVPARRVSYPRAPGGAPRPRDLQPLAARRPPPSPPSPLHPPGAAPAPTVAPGQPRAAQLPTPSRRAAQPVSAGPGGGQSAGGPTQQPAAGGRHGDRALFLL